MSLTRDIERARAKWQFRGQARPVFADTPGRDQESVWDFPRPPRIEPVCVRLQVLLGDSVLAATDDGVRVVETAGAPTYYFPPGDVNTIEFSPIDGESVCEWKGVATSYGCKNIEPAAWCYLRTFPEFSSIRGWYGFYPVRLECFVGEERVRPQPGGYYGGWVTANLAGPIKGSPGTEHW